MPFTVYVFYSDTAKKHYTGFTENLVERQKSHNEPGNEWTARYRPWWLIFHKDFEAKFNAMKYEEWLKKARGERLLKLYYTRHF